MPMSEIMALPDSDARRSALLHDDRLTVVLRDVPPPRRLHHGHIGGRRVTMTGLAVQPSAGAVVCFKEELGARQAKRIANELDSEAVDLAIGPQPSGDSSQYRSVVSGQR